MAFETSLPLPAPVWASDLVAPTWPSNLGIGVNWESGYISQKRWNDDIGTSNGNRIRWGGDAGGRTLAQVQGLPCVRYLRSAGTGNTQTSWRPILFCPPFDGSALPAGFANPESARMLWLRWVVRCASFGNLDANQGIFALTFNGDIGAGATLPLYPNGASPAALFSCSPYALGGGHAWRYASFAGGTGAVLETVDTTHDATAWTVIDWAIRGAQPGVGAILTVTINGEVAASREFGTANLETPDAQGGAGIGWGISAYTTTGPSEIQLNQWRCRQGAYTPDGEPLSS